MSVKIDKHTAKHLAWLKDWTMRGNAQLPKLVDILGPDDPAIVSFRKDMAWGEGRIREIEAGTLRVAPHSNVNKPPQIH